MRKITLKPACAGHYQAFTRKTATEAESVTVPFPAEQLRIEKQLWEQGGFKVVIKDNKFAEVE